MLIRFPKIQTSQSEEKQLKPLNSKICTNKTIKIEKIVFRLHRIEKTSNEFEWENFFHSTFWIVYETVLFFTFSCPHPPLPAATYDIKDDVNEKNCTRNLITWILLHFDIGIVDRKKMDTIYLLLLYEFSCGV